MKRFTVVALVIAVTLGLFGSLATATPQTQYPAPGTWMADCPTAPRAVHIAYHWMPGPTPSQRPWCNLVNDGVTSQVWVVDPPLDGVGMSAAFSTSNWDSSDIYNEVAISTMQSVTEETAHLTALYALIDARIALTPGSGPTLAEFDAAVQRIGNLEAAQAVLQTNVATLQSSLITAQSDIGTLQAQVAVLQGLFSTMDAKQTNIYDSLKAFHALFDPTQ